MTESFKKKIPDNMHPWECEVNGVKYVYPAGTEQDVPEEVAVIIDAYWASRETNFPNTAISFNELRDRPFGEDTAVLFDQTVEFTDGQWQTNEVLPISEGDTVKVTFEGAEYELTAYTAPNGLTFVGNPAGFDLEDNGIPFTVATGSFGGEGLLGMMAFGYTKASIKIEGVVVKTIDPKFLPGGGGGGYCHVNVWYDEDNESYVADKTYAEIKAAEASKTPIVGTFTIADGRVFTMIGCDGSSEAIAYLVAFDISGTPELLTYDVHISEGGSVYVSGTIYQGTTLDDSFFYPT